MIDGLKFVIKDNDGSLEVYATIVPITLIMKMTSLIMQLNL